MFSTSFVLDRTEVTPFGPRVSALWGRPSPDFPPRHVSSLYPLYPLHLLRAAGLRLLCGLQYPSRLVEHFHRLVELFTSHLGEVRQIVAVR
jgi:hypothetical protein